mgnify:CR=1 FL=1
MTSPFAYQALSRAIKEWDQPPTALFISSDAMVQGVLHALDEAGWAIPEQIS